MGTGGTTNFYVYNVQIQKKRSIQIFRFQTQSPDIF